MHRCLLELESSKKGSGVLQMHDNLDLGTKVFIYHLQLNTHFERKLRLKSGKLQKAAPTVAALIRFIGTLSRLRLHERPYRWEMNCGTNSDINRKRKAARKGYAKLSWF